MYLQTRLKAMMVNGSLSGNKMPDIGQEIRPSRRRRFAPMRKSSLSGKLLLWTINALVWGAVAAVIWGIL